MRKTLVILWLALAISPLAQADVSLKTPTALGPVIAMAPGVLLVDARGLDAVRQQPLQGATPYVPGMKRIPGMVVVVADNDEQAMAVATALAQPDGQAVYALSGGPVAWQEILDERKKSPSAVPFNFVIPHNTCQQGKPLQEYKK
ncbi:MAG: hypothetical protein KJ558_08775 [Gammaproteobacteria bacterium]|nr:hypothetical protein [Gammaproteobacteria bacterium]MBU1654902.1 hypothetical protein [Gammaproteobacteria bacterium]MBU1960593.1 hypothetical protein [Gammaproteobacteria bacterium]